MNGAEVCVGIMGCVRPGPAANVSPALGPPAGSIEDPPPAPRTKPPTDDGDFSSERGVVHLVRESEGTLAGTYPNGILPCRLNGELASCDWTERGSDGRAVFRRRSDGRFEGTYGSGESTSDSGAWNL